MIVWVSTEELLDCAIDLALLVMASAPLEIQLESMVLNNISN